MRRRTAGFTLAEVLVALVVLTSGLLIISQGFLTGGTASVRAQQLTIASSLADAKMAEIEGAIVPFSASTSGTFELEGEPDYAWELKPESTATAGLTKVTLTVKWKERSEERTFDLVRLLTERAAR